MRRLHAGILAATLLALATPTAAVADGASLYQAACAQCHGADGSADTPVAKAMNVPSLRGLSPDAVIAAVRGTAAHQAAASELSDEDLAAIAKAVAGFGG